VSERRRARVLVRGRVQGVGFRAAAHSRARSLQVAGWVRNNPDGSLEAELEGPRERVESLLVWFRRGPHAADIEAVAVEWRKPVGEALFTIR
jgi:acylphosphatase